MLKKRMILIYSVIILCAMLIMMTVAVLGLQRLFYHESQLIYDAQIDRSYDTIENAFVRMQSFALDVCINEPVQEILRKGEENGWDGKLSEQLDATVDMAVYPEQQYIICVYPVSEGVVLMKDEKGTYEPSDSRADAYDIAYGFLWDFRPQDSDTVRVTRKIYDSENPMRLLGLMTVDLNILNISEIFWTFSARGSVEGKLYLFDENDELMLPYTSRQVELSELRVREISSVSYELHNETITVARSFSQNGWKLMCVIEGSSLLGGSKSLIMLILCIGGLLVAIGVVLTAFAAQRLTHPIMKLAEFMDESGARENYGLIAVDEGLQGEMRILYDSYNTLMLQLRRSMDEIRLAGEREVRNEFLLLQAQINPHFLYNTLDSIGWIAVKHGATEIRDMTIYLVGMFRNSLNNGSAMIEVGGEIEQVRCYLNIMMMRYPDRYTAEYNVEDGVENLVIIKQILQPLAENALQHGFYDTESAGRILIRAFTQGEDLVLEVRNNGQLADLDKINDILHAQSSGRMKHYGIRNVDERLRKFYGPQSGLRFRHEDGYTVVSVSIPKEKLTDGEEQGNE